MKTLNHCARQDFNSWPPRSIVVALSIQIHLILPLNLYSEHYMPITHTPGCKIHKNFQFKILHFYSFSGWLQLILKQMIKLMQTYWSRSMITGLNRYVEHLYCENCQVKCWLRISTPWFLSS
jgi:hypothetical protein